MIQELQKCFSGLNNKTFYAELEGANSYVRLSSHLRCFSEYQAICYNIPIVDNKFAAEENDMGKNQLLFPPHIVGSPN